MKKNIKKKCQVNDPKIGTKCTCKNCLEIKKALREAYSKDKEYKYYMADWE